MSRWDARGWVAGLMDLDKGDLAKRSIDRHGASEMRSRAHIGHAPDGTFQASARG